MHMASTTASGGGGGGGRSGGINVLSDKVNRALHVRTDTPAMRAALEALANLPSGDDYGVGTAGGKGGSGPSSAGGVIDARSVRAAIEKDALRRALEFQRELQKLARDATMMRERVDNVAKVAALVGKCLETQIVDEPSPSGSDPAGASASSDDHFAPAAAAQAVDADAREEERNLASRLASSQKAYVEALRRQRAVNSFLDKFDIGEDEARLLDHYNFEGFVSSEAHAEGEEGNPWSHPGAALDVVPNPTRGAMDDSDAFLNALERLAVVRRELTKTFGSGTDPDEEDAPFDRSLSVTNDGGLGRGGGRLGAHSALRMMEQLASRQERAHERLYSFIQFFLGIGNAAPSSNTMMVPTSSTDTGRSLSVVEALGRFHDGDEMDEAFNHPVVRRSLHVLRHSRAHRIHALELIAAGRRTEVTRRFLLALTSGYGGMAPLEVKAHDPVAYVGDMLAFAFRAFRVEGELVKTLFLWKDEGERSDQESKDKETDDGYAEEKQLGDYIPEEEDDKPLGVAEMLSQSMGGLSRPLRTRVSQVVSSLASQGGNTARPDGNGDLVVRSSYDCDEASSSGSLNRLVAVFSVCGLLRFYGSAVEKALDKSNKAAQPENPFFTTCVECLAEAADSYVASLRAFGAMLGTHALGSPESEVQLAQRAIVRISEERVVSPGFAEDLASPHEDEDLVAKQLSLSFLVSTMIDAAMPYLKTLDDGAVLKSALSVALKCGLDAGQADKWSRVIQETEKELAERFVDMETDEVLQVCGLEGLRSAMGHMNGLYVEGMTMATHPGLSQGEVEGAMKKFYSSLFSPPIPTFEDSIKDAELRKVARSKTAERVAEVYCELHTAMTSDRGGYPDLAFLGHDPDQVKTLLSL